jgi:hypothetical protein
VTSSTCSVRSCRSQGYRYANAYISTFGVPASTRLAARRRHDALRMIFKVCMRRPWKRRALGYPDGMLGPIKLRRTEGAVLSIAGRWRITEMELWDQEAMDLVEPAFIEFGEDETGNFGFIAVRGWMDCRDAPRDGRPGVEFSWEGNDDCDPACGRGWAALKADGSLHGHIYFHLGDDSDFHAVHDDAESQRGTPNVP